MQRALVVLLLAACGGGHRHGPAAHPEDTRHLYVEIAAERGALRDGAAKALSTIGFVRPVDEGGDVELQLEVSRLDVVSNQTMCSVKILVLRLHQHDLLGIADGNARVRGHGDAADDDCLESLAATLVRGKLRVLLQRRLAAKR